MNFYNDYIRSIFKFCAILGAQRIPTTGFNHAQGNAHCAKFESNTNKMTFETNTNRMTSDIHTLSDVKL